MLGIELLASISRSRALRLLTTRHVNRYNSLCSLASKYKDQSVASVAKMLRAGGTIRNGAEPAYGAVEVPTVDLSSRQRSYATPCVQYKSSLTSHV